MVRQLPMIFLFFLTEWLVQAFYCPLGTYQGSAFSGKLEAALGVSTISLSQEQQFFLYNYSMPFQLQIPPEIAVAVHDFEFQQSKHIFYYIKPIKTSSISYILFGIRIKWGYTKWKRISFSFLAEDRTDLESGYYMVDSGQLSSHKMGKFIQSLLPFRTLFNSNSLIQHKLFLHGFQITTSLINNTTRSPFEIQIVSSFAKKQGIFVSLSATTETEINSIFISYIAYQQINLKVVSGKYTYDSSIFGSKLYHSIQNPNQKSYSRIYGLTGFIITYYSQRVIFSTKWDGSTFNFDLGIGNQYVKYLSFQYLFFSGSSCSQCNGYQIVYNYNCVNQCPLGTTLTPQLTCIDCGQGRYFNGTTCVYKCLDQQKINGTLSCNCPKSLNWDGQNCVPCSLGKTWNIMQKKCQCLYPYIWDGFNCSRFDECKFGKIWDPYSYSCKCKQDSFWNSKQCQKLPQCQGGQVLDTGTNTCRCPKNKIMINNSCDFPPCVGGQFWTGDNCTCHRGFNFNGQICIQCQNKEKWNNEKLSCQCQWGYQRNGKDCQKIANCKQGGRVWDEVLEQCMCPDKNYWFGSNCVPIENCRKGQYFDLVLFRCQCIFGQFWNGTMCIQCQNGKVWDKKQSLCTCPPGTELIQSKCISKQVCKGGKLWVQNLKACLCPSKTAWNGTYCSDSPCQNGKFWNSSSKSCVCGLNLVEVNEICLPQQRKCSNGRIWNKQLYSCECQAGAYSLKNQKCQTKLKCDNNKTLNPFNGMCECKYGLKEINENCTVPNCMKQYAWNGFQCEATICPPLFYFEQGRCVYGFQNKCGFSKYWNGKNCQQYSLNCPNGTKWANFYCESVSKCPNGSYIKNQTCKPLPTKTLKYTCPEGINNGTACIECGRGKKYTHQGGCECPKGQFDTGLSCEYISFEQCSMIQNSIWTQQQCQCKRNFSQINLHCYCQGVIVNGNCDHCFHRPNSVYSEEKKFCVCKDNYILIQQKCIKLNTYSKGDEPSKCTVGTFYEMSAKMCLPCDLGCLSCFNSYKCRACQPEFYFDYLTDRCFQLCGDGRKFYLGCDDGNNVDGDGCSRDCQVEAQYICTGGSPQNPDICYINKPKSINFSQAGQIRKQTSIILYIRANYLPKSLLYSNDCGYKCSNILLCNATNGDKEVKSIKSQLLIGNTNTFMIKVEFGRNIFGKFTLLIGLNGSIAKYFNYIPFIPLQISVQPKHLFQVNQF